MRCDRCKWKYPSQYLNQMFIGANAGLRPGYTKPICGICALELTNELHGVVQTAFNGEMAESSRLAAIQWRKTHPNDGPVNGEGLEKKD